MKANVRQNVIYLLLFSLFSNSLEAIENSPSPRNGSVQSGPVQILHSVVREGWTIVFGPIALFPKLAERRRSGKDPKDALIETAKEDGPYLAGFGILTYGLHRFENAFFQIDYDAFKKATDSQMNPHPKKVLYINGIASSDPIAGYPEFYFQQQYGSHADATFIKVDNYSDFLKKLKNLSQDSSFDRIEIVGHGAPGIILIGKKNSPDAILGKNRPIKAADLANLRDLNIGIAAPNAEIRFISCSMAANTPIKSAGENILKEFGEVLLPKGGTIFGATRNIIVFKPPISVRAVIDSLGIQNFLTIWEKLLSGSVWRNYRQVHSKAIKVSIPPAVARSCGATFSRIK